MTTQLPASANNSLAVLNNKGQMATWMGRVGRYVNQLVTQTLSWFVIQNSASNSSFDVQSDTGDGSGMQSRFRVENNAASALVDMDVRRAVLNIGNYDTSVDASGTKINMSHVSGDSANFIEVYQPGTGLGGIGPHAPRLIWRLTQAGAVVIACGGVGSNALTIEDSTEANPRCQWNEFGKWTLGPGGATALDTIAWYRGAAGQIKTDSDLAVVGKWGVNGTAPVAAQAISGALSTVTDAAAKAVLTSIIAALTATGQATDSTT